MIFPDRNTYSVLDPFDLFTPTEALNRWDFGPHLESGVNPASVVDGPTDLYIGFASPFARKNPGAWGRAGQISGNQSRETVGRGRVKSRKFQVGGEGELNAYEDRNVAGR
jgi:hypothetical protein